MRRLQVGLQVVILGGAYFMFMMFLLMVAISQPGHTLYQGPVALWSMAMVVLVLPKTSVVIALALTLTLWLGGEVTLLDSVVLMASFTVGAVFLLHIKRVLKEF